MDLSQFSADQLQQLKQAIEGLTDTSGRTPELLPRQLHDLRKRPAWNDPRPTFFWSAEEPRNGIDLGKTKPYPRLMWHSTTGQEITVANVKAQETHTAQGFILTPPENAEKPDPLDAAREAIEALSPEDRKTVLLAAQRTRLARVQEMASGLTDAELEALVSSLDTSKRRSA
jgi:hypothetical protein